MCLSMHVGFVQMPLKFSTIHWVCGLSYFIHAFGTTRLYLLVYVDDFLIIGNDVDRTEQLILKMSIAFKICNHGTQSFCS